MITSAFRWFDALIRRCILCDTDCCHCLRVYVLPTVSLRPSRARSDAIRRSSLRLVFSEQFRPAPRTYCPFSSRLLMRETACTRRFQLL